jgi:hypothetical protein
VSGLRDTSGLGRYAKERSAARGTGGGHRVGRQRVPRPLADRLRVTAAQRLMLVGVHEHTVGLGQPYATEQSLRDEGFMRSVRSARALVRKDLLLVDVPLFFLYRLTDLGKALAMSWRCATCGHFEVHCLASGCNATRPDGSYCDCEAFVSGGYGSVAGAPP